MTYLRNLLAAYEVHVADYYLRRKAYVAAANRGRYVVENFQGTPSVGDGLAVMTEAYQHLGLNDLAATSLETLKMNYPDNPSLDNGEFKPKQRSEDDRSWLARATLGLVDRPSEPLPPGETRAAQDVQRQYEDAKREIPQELLPENQPAAGESENPDAPRRSWFSRLTFGLFD